MFHIKVLHNQIVDRLKLLSVRQSAGIFLDGPAMKLEFKHIRFFKES